VPLERVARHDGGARCSEQKAADARAAQAEEHPGYGLGKIVGTADEREEARGWSDALAVFGGGSAR